MTKIEGSPVDSYTERKRIREERQRSETEGYREDVANLCRCPECGGVHYRPRPETKQDEQVK